MEIRSQPLGPGRVLRTLVRASQNRLAAVFEVTIDRRTSTVESMLARNPSEPVHYWLQLTLATGIATFGLVLDSSAVVIGAMLISPLMSPLVRFGMGLAIGSPFLVIRSFLRTFFSMVYVVGAGAVLTNLLPLNQVTDEIVARTSPTALDLVIAAFCAVAAAYTTVRTTSETASAAAGTAIGIALVPPLCVSGYGVGSGVGRIAGGALLLFTANFCAILLVTVLIFLALGYNQVPVLKLEQGELEKGGDSTLARKMASTLQRFFFSKYGPVLRVLMPMMLVGAVYLPLRNALSEVTWEVRVRSSIKKLLSDLPKRAVQTNVIVERHNVTVSLVTVGTRAEAEELERRMTAEITSAAGVEPTVTVLAVPDADALRAVVDTVKVPEPAAPVPTTPNLELVRGELQSAMKKSWPADVAGPLLDYRISFPEDGAMIIRVFHAGAPLGGAGTRLLSDALEAPLGVDVEVRDVPFSLEPLSAEPEEGRAWSANAALRLNDLARFDRLYACMLYPASLSDEQLGPRTPGTSAVAWSTKTKKRIHAFELQRDEVLAELRANPWLKSERVSFTPGERWSLSLSLKPCSKPAKQETKPAP